MTIMEEDINLCKSKSGPNHEWLVHQLHNFNAMRALYMEYESDTYVVHAWKVC